MHGNVTSTSIVPDLLGLDLWGEAFDGAFIEQVCCCWSPRLDGTGQVGISRFVSTWDNLRGVVMTAARDVV